MNRSILIVICDFLVLSALSLSTGITQITPTDLAQGTSIPVEEAVSMDKVRELLKKRAEERKQKESAEEQLQKLKKEHEKLKLSLAERSMSLGQADKMLQETRKQFARVTASHQADKRLLEQTRAKLAVTEQELTKTRKTVVEKSTELTQANTKVGVLSRALDQSVQKGIKAEQDRAAASAMLQDANQRLGSAQKQSTALIRQLEEKQKEISRKDTSMISLMEKLSQSDKQLALANLSLQNLKSDLLRKEMELSSARKTILDREKLLKITEEQLRNSAVDYYSKAALRLDYRIHNQRALSSAYTQKTLYLPKVRIGNENYLVSSFQSLSGLNRKTSAYSRITTLEYTVGETNSPRRAHLSGLFYSLAENPEICLVPLAGPVSSAVSKAVALSPISFGELKQRGVDDLILFKEDQFGSSAVNLKGRCSLQFGGAENSGLIIRNAVRDSSQIPAAPGDFVIDKLGRFVGVVTRVTADETGRREEAFCSLIPQEIRLGQAVKIPLEPKDAFMNTVNAMKKKIQEKELR